jgi:hypothetical protein
MKRIFVYIIIFASSALIYVACSESFLERAPLDQPSEATFYQSEADAVAALNSVYDVMQYSQLWKFEITVIGNRFNNDVGILPRLTEFPNGFNTNNLRRLNMWPALYQGINRANIVLEKIPEIEMDEALKTRLMGEAKFLRGFYYFTLATFFGDIPLRLESTDLNNIAREKSPYEDVINQVRQDLNEAISQLQERSEMAPADLGRATVGAARALLGKLELYEENYAEAASHFGQVINSGEYALHPVYAELFLAGNDNLAESLFEVQHQSNGGGWANSNEGSWISGWNGVGGQGTINFGFGGTYQPNQTLVDAYEEGDIRKDFTIVADGDDYFGTPFNADQSATAYGQRKYILPAELEPGAGDSPVNYHIIRYADVLMMYAEALNEINNGPTQEAYDAINAVRTRAELDPLPMGMSQQAFFDALVQERRVELFLEAHRTWDLIRWGLGEEVLTPTVGFIPGLHERLPIPQSELDTNPLMTQNEGYD